MISKHDEIEIKLPGDEINEDVFKTWAMSRGAVRFIEVEGPDHFYKQGNNVLRLRVPPNESPELTVKNSKNGSDSTLHRSEIDLRFSNEIEPYDIEKFLFLAGFEHDFSLHKRALVFWIETNKQAVTLSLYFVKFLNTNKKPKAFVEIEVVKNSDVSVEVAKGTLTKWLNDLNSYFKLNKPLEPINKSLYTIFKEEKEND